MNFQKKALKKIQLAYLKVDGRTAFLDPMYKVGQWLLALRGIKAGKTGTGNDLFAPRRAFVIVHTAKE